MPSKITPQEAGRRGGLVGGKSKSAAKLAAAKRNGFQRADNQPAPDTASAISESVRPASARPAVLLTKTITIKEN